MRLQRRPEYRTHAVLLQLLSRLAAAHATQVAQRGAGGAHNKQAFGKLTQRCDCGRAAANEPLRLLRRCRLDCQLQHRVTRLDGCRRRPRCATRRCNATGRCLYCSCNDVRRRHQGQACCRVGLQAVVYHHHHLLWNAALPERGHQRLPAT